jgi:hypothetical protein
MYIRSRIIISGAIVLRATSAALSKDGGARPRNFLSVKCLLLPLSRTFRDGGESSAFDPKWTFSLSGISGPRYWPLSTPLVPPVVGGSPLKVIHFDQTFEGYDAE